MLKPKAMEVYIMEYDEFEKLIQQDYGFKYDYIFGEETNNGEYKLYLEVDGTSFGIWEEDEFEEWVRKVGRGEGFKAEAILNDMVKKGTLPPGNYIIETSW